MNYVTWFSILYFIGAYLRNYDCFGIKPQSWKWIALGSVGLSVTSVLAILWVNARFGLSMSPYGLVSDSNRILAVITGISLFMTFKHWKMHYSKFVNTVARSAFGVLLIHANSDAAVVVGRYFGQCGTLYNKHFFDFTFIGKCTGNLCSMYLNRLFAY